MMVRLAEQAELNLSQEDKNKLRIEEKKKVAARKTTSWRVWRSTTEPNVEKKAQTRSVDVEKKQEDKKQLHQDKKVEKKATIVLQKSKLGQKTTTRKNNTINKYKQHVHGHQTTKLKQPKYKENEKKKTSPKNNNIKRIQAEITTTSIPTQPKLVDQSEIRTRVQLFPIFIRTEKLQNQNYKNVEKSEHKVAKETCPAQQPTVDKHVSRDKPRGKSKPPDKSKPDPKPAPDIRSFFRKPKLSQSLLLPDQTPAVRRELPGNPPLIAYTCTQPQIGGKKLIPGDALNSDRK